MSPNEIARSWGGGIEVRSEPARARWSFSDPVTADGHRLRCSFACSVRPLMDAAERKLLGETLLSRKPVATIEDVIAHFAPSLQAAAANTAATKNVADWLAEDGKAPLIESLRKSADKAAFGCGLEVLAPFTVDLESPSFQQQKLEAMERNLAQQRVAGQVEHFEKAATLLKQFDTLRQAAPGITPGAVLQQISPSDQGTMLQTLLLAAGKERTTKGLWAVAGPYLVKVDPRVSPPKLELIALPETLGPLRSVQPAEVDGQGVLLVGARSGVMVVSPDKPGEPQLYNDPDVVTQMGFSRAIAWRHGIWACHADAGIDGWEQGVTDHPGTMLRPANLAPSAPAPPPGDSGSSTSIEVNKPGSPRNLVAIDDSRLMFSLGERLLTVDPQGQVTALPVESRSEVIAILPDRRSVYVVREDASVTTHELATLAVGGEERRGGRAVAAAVLPWLGSVRLLIAIEDGPIHCLGTEDQLVTQYLSGHRGLRMIAAVADFVVAVSADRQRLVLWNTWDGRKPVTEVSVSAVAKHRIADVDFG
jgi:hypothetical protein